MEHRREPRINVTKNVTLRVVTLMGEPEAGQPVNARVVDVSGSGVRLELPLPVPCGAAVEIEDQHIRILGETLRCDPQGEAYIVAVRVAETTLIDDAYAPPRVPSFGQR